MVITWENWEVVSLTNENIFVEFYCESHTSENYCEHGTYVLSIWKTELEEMWTTIFYYSWIMIIGIMIILFLLKGLFYKFFKK